MTATIVLAVLSLIQTVLPLLLKPDSQAQVDKIIDMLAKLVPTVINGGANLIAAFKGVTAALAKNPEATEIQLARLKALDSVVDAAFEDAAAAVDPDSPVAGTT